MSWSARPAARPAHGSAAGHPGGRASARLGGQHRGGTQGTCRPGRGTFVGIPVEHSPPIPRPIILVEDERDAAEMVALDLTSRGFEVHVAHSADGGLALIHHLGRPALVLLDIMMPGRGGNELLTHLYFHEPALFHQTRFIVVSATHRLPYELEVMDLVWVRKPYALHQLAAVVSRHAFDDTATATG